MTVSVQLGAALSALALMAIASAEDERAEEGRLLFERKIRTVFLNHCFTCHSAQAKPLKAGLRLDERKTLLEGGDSGAAVVPGKPGESLLIQVLEHSSEIAMMPPGKRLPDAVLADFRRWVELGAPYPAPSKDKEAEGPGRSR